VRRSREDAAAPAAPEGDGDEAAVKAGRASSALAWSLTNTITSKLGTLFIGIALARLLGPEEFGTFAVALIALMAILSFNELGVSLAIVRWEKDPRAIAPTVNAISLGSSLVLTAAALLAAPYFATAMGDPGATDVVRWLSLCVLVNGAVAVPAAVLQRYFRQDKRTVADQVNVWLGAGISLAMAFSGFGAMSLVVGRLSGAVVSGLLLVVFSPLPYRVGIDRQYLRPLLSFGLPLAGASIIVFAVGFVDQIAVGKLLGPTVLGYYVLAYNLANWPVIVLSHPTRNVAPAMFARIQHNPSASRLAFNQLLRPLASIALPACVVLSAASDEIVGFVYGSQWQPASAALRWLALLAALRVLFELVYDYLVVLRMSRAILLINTAWFLVLIPVLVGVAAASGIAGVGLAQVAVALVVVLPLYLFQLHRAGIGPRSVYRSVLPAVAGSVVLYGAIHALHVAELTGLLTLGLSGMATLGTAALLLYFARDDLRSWRSTEEVAT
jgi:PST family polysaccharide transporter